MTNIFDEYFLQCMNFMSTIIFMLFTSSLFFFSRSNFEMRLVHDTFVPLFRTHANIHEVVRVHINKIRAFI